jgi:superkiller protein 3
MIYFFIITSPIILQKNDNSIISPNITANNSESIQIKNSFIKSEYSLPQYVKDFSPIGPKNYGTSQYWMDVGNNNRQTNTIKAIEAYTNVTKIEPGNFDAWFEMSIVYLNDRRYVKAADTADKAIQLNPVNSSAWGIKYEALCGMQQYDQALEAIEKVIGIHPDNDYALNKKWETLNILSRDEEKYKVYALMIDIRSKNAIKGRKYQDYGEFFPINPPVTPTMTPAIPKTVQYYIDLGDSNLQNEKDALDAYFRAVNLDQTIISVWLKIAHIYMKEQRYEEAANTSDKVIKLDKLNSTGWGLKSEALFQMKNYDQALDIVNNAIQLDHDNDYILQLKGKILKSMQRVLEADDILRRASILEERNKDAGYHNGYRGCNI